MNDGQDRMSIAKSVALLLLYNALALAAFILHPDVIQLTGIPEWPVHAALAGVLLGAVDIAQRCVRNVPPRGVSMAIVLTAGLAAGVCAHLL